MFVSLPPQGEEGSFAVALNNTDLRHRKNRRKKLEIR